MFMFRCIFFVLTCMVCFSVFFVYFLLCFDFRCRNSNWYHFNCLQLFIWGNYDVNTLTDRRKSRFPHNTGEPQKLPTVTFYDNFLARLNRKWCHHIRSNPILCTARVVSAFRKHKNLREHLVKGRFGRYQEDVEHNLDLLINAINTIG